MTTVKWGCAIATLGLAWAASAAAADDTLKLAVGQRGNWDTSVSEIGQRAGIFKKHGLTLEIVYTQGAGDLYWYVKTDSPIKSLKDTDGKTLAYSTNGSSTHGIVTAFIKQYNLTAKPTSTGGPAGTLTQVMSGQIDVGWSAPPFRLDQPAPNHIR